MPINIQKSIGLFSIICALLIFIFWAGYRLYPESSPVARGAEYAEMKGCVDCHGQPNNPLVDFNDQQCSNINKSSTHVNYDVDCTDVLAYFEAIRLQRSYSERLEKSSSNQLLLGEGVVRKYHCFQCHGLLGQGGFKNHKSLKGYVPGYFGNDFKILTDGGNANSIRQWISHGLDQKLIDTFIIGPMAEYFFDRQAINMPSYKALEASEIELLITYVKAINQYGPMTASDIRLYGANTQLINLKKSPTK